MAYSPISEVNIALQLSGITAVGFGTPIFIADIDISDNSDPFGNGVRVKSYGSLSEVAVDFEVTDAAYIAAQGFLSNSPSVSTFKLGYRNTDSGDTETLAEAYAAIKLVDEDFYFVTAEDHTTAEVLALAAAVEADTRQYFTSSQDEATLTVFDEGVSDDTLAKLIENGYDRTKGYFHHTADTAFPECQIVGFNAPFPAGSVSWSNLNISGLAPSQDPATGLPLNSSQKGYVDDRNAGYTERLSASTVIVRNGKSAGGTPLDFIRGRDNMEADINTAQQQLLVSQKGGKLPYTNAGITQIYSAVDDVLTTYASPSRNFIEPNYVMTFLMADQVPLVDKESRIYQSGSFEAQLTGAIEGTKITGALALEI